MQGDMSHPVKGAATWVRKRVAGGGLVLSSPTATSWLLLWGGADGAWRTQTLWRHTLVRGAAWGQTAGGLVRRASDTPSRSNRSLTVLKERCPVWKQVLLQEARQHLASTS